MNEQKNNEIMLKAMMAEDQLSAIRIYCEESAPFDEQLQESLKNPDKSFEKCWAYIMEKAKTHLKNQSGHVMPSIIFGWAIHYFIESNEIIEKEVGKIKDAKVPTNKATSETKHVQDKKSNTKKTTDQDKTPFERMSIFDLMEDD